MFSPCVFCVLPCVTSTFTVSKLARIIKQASRVGGCERVFTPVRWRQVRLSCIKWRSTFFYIFSCVRSSVGSSSSGWTAVAPTVMLGWRGSSLDARQPHLASTYGSKNSLTPPHPTSLLYYPSEFRNRKGTGHTRKNTENTRWKHHHRNFNGSAQYVDTATTLLPCNRAPATNGQSTNMTSQTHVNVSTKHADTTAVQHRQYHGNTAVIPRSFKMNNVEYICTKCFENFATEDEYIPLGEQSPCRLRDGNAISVEWISSSTLNALSIALLSTPTL